jgi:fatty acid desaturase
MEKIGKHWEPPFTITRGLKLWGLSLVGGNLKDQFIMASNMPKGNSREKILLGLFTLLMFLTAYEFNQFAILGLWFYSLISTNLSTFRIETWFEHSLDTANTNRYQLPNIFFRPIVPHNIWIHYEHHKSPSIPFYNLAMARELDSSQKIMTFEEMELSLSKQWKPNDQFERAA